jgi:hypothetical protein
MKLFDILSVAALSLLVGACATTSSSDKASKQAEIRQAAQQSLSKFYKADPKLQSAVANAPGYAVFTTYGLSFIVGGFRRRGPGSQQSDQRRHVHGHGASERGLADRGRAERHADHLQDAGSDADVRG